MLKVSCKSLSYKLNPQFVKRFLTVIGNNFFHAGKIYTVMLLSIVFSGFSVSINTRTSFDEFTSIYILKF